MAQARALSISDRLGIVSRIAAALLGGYAFANVVGVFLSRVLPLSRAEGVLSMTLLSFALYAGAVIWVFAARSATRAWLGLVVPMAVLGAAAWLIGAAG